MSGVDLSNVGLAEIVAFVSLAGTVTTFVMRPGKAAGEAAGKLADRVEKVEERLAVVESEMEHLPDKDSAHRMELAITRLEGRFEALGERLNPLAAIADRPQEFLLDQAKGGR